MRRLPLLALLSWLSFCTPARAQDAQPMLDLTGWVVYLNPAADANQTPIEPLVAQQLVTRVGNHSGVAWQTITGGAFSRDAQGILAIGLKSRAKDWAGVLAEKVSDPARSNAAEGYSIVVDAERKRIAVAGNDARGIVYGVGRLLRELRYARGGVALPAGFQVDSAPATKLRGHQLGYRPKTNSYDAWGVAQWNEYFWDLAFFGANAIELVPPRTDDDLESPHFPLPPLDMMERMSRLADQIGLDVWIWFPVMDPVDTDPSKAEPLLKEWDTVFRRLPRVDAVFVPGGDPGAIPPKPLFAFLDRAKVVLRQTHPKATMWVSPQGFDAPRFDEFLALLKTQPAWLDGLVFGPQVRMHLGELRKTIPAKYPIRGYPDITHSRQCQHPVPDWDLAYAVTEGRESINPRPRAMAALVEAYAPHTIGFISYSEGCNDDVNKAVWSAMAWDPKADIVDVLRQYARLYLGGPGDAIAQGLLALERNWSGPLVTNAGVETTLDQFQDLERTGPPRLLQNWRFQQALYRAYYDGYIRDRLIHETSLRHEAMGRLRLAGRVGSLPALADAASVLDRALSEPVSLDRRARVFELGEALFQSIRMQLSKPKYQAIDPERGANLDTIDIPLTDRVWLNAEFNQIRLRPLESERLALIEALSHWTDPGPGGFYDDLGDAANSPHLVRTPGPAADPMFEKTSFHGFALRVDWPQPWRQYIQTFHDAPILMHYDGLDPSADYIVRVVYSGDSPRARMRLEADGTVIHDLFVKPNPVASVEFAVPREATRDGVLNLKWNQEPGRGGNGRGCQVAEVWLKKKRP